MDRQTAIEQAKAMAPALRERALKAEALRRMPDETIDELAASGLVELMAPRRYGGHEADLDVLAAAVIEVGKSCGSTAWTLCIYGIHNWLAGLFAEPLQEELFAGRAPVLFPGSWAPSGQATPVDGGYRVSGRWQFGSGIHHASWASVAAVVEQDDERPFPDVRCFLVPRADVEVIDTWYTSGLRGTGSMDLALTDVFVPAHRVEGFGPIANGEAPGADLHGAPIYRMPLFCALPTAAAAPAVGMAKGALEAFGERIAGRTLRYSAQRQAEHASAHRRLGHTAARVRAAETLLDATIEGVTSTLHAGRRLGADQRVALRRDCAYVVATCKAAVADMAEASGASAQFEDSPLQRHLRDIQTLSTHVVFDTDGAYELAGRVALGLPPASVMF